MGTPICPMPALTLRQSLPMAFQWHPNNAGNDGRPVSGTSVAAHVGVQKKKLLESFAGALERFTKYCSLSVAPHLHGRDGARPSQSHFPCAVFQ